MAFSRLVWHLAPYLGGEAWCEKRSGIAIGQEESHYSRSSVLLYHLPYFALACHNPDPICFVGHLAGTQISIYLYNARL